MKLPDDVNYESAACCLEDGLRAYMALHYHGRVSARDTVLIMDATSAFGCLVIQLAHLWNARVSVYNHGLCLHINCHLNMVLLTACIICNTA